MKKAIIENGIIVNVIEAEPDHVIQGKTLVDLEENFGIGDKHINGKFERAPRLAHKPPKDEPKPLPEWAMDIVEALETGTVPERLKNRVQKQKDKS